MTPNDTQKPLHNTTATYTHRIRICSQYDAHFSRPLDRDPLASHLNTHSQRPPFLSTFTTSNCLYTFYTMASRHDEAQAASRRPLKKDSTSSYSARSTMDSSVSAFDASAKILSSDAVSGSSAAAAASSASEIAAAAAVKRVSITNSSSSPTPASLLGLPPQTRGPVQRKQVRSSVYGADAQEKVAAAATAAAKTAPAAAAAAGDQTMAYRKSLPTFKLSSGRDGDAPSRNSSASTRSVSPGNPLPKPQPAQTPAASLHSQNTQNNQHNGQPHSISARMPSFQTLQKQEKSRNTHSTEASMAAATTAAAAAILPRQGSGEPSKKSRSSLSKLSKQAKLSIKSLSFSTNKNRSSPRLSRSSSIKSIISPEITRTTLTNPSINRYQDTDSSESDDDDTNTSVGDTSSTNPLTSIDNTGDLSLPKSASSISSSRSSLSRPDEYRKQGPRFIGHRSSNSSLNRFTADISILPGQAPDQLSVSIPAPTSARRSLDIPSPQTITSLSGKDKEKEKEKDTLISHFRRSKKDPQAILSSHSSNSRVSSEVGSMYSFNPAHSGMHKNGSILDMVSSPVSATSPSLPDSFKPLPAQGSVSANDSTAVSSLTDEIFAAKAVGASQVNATPTKDKFYIGAEDAWSIFTARTLPLFNGPFGGSRLPTPVEDLNALLIRALQKAPSTSTAKGIKEAKMILKKVYDTFHVGIANGSAFLNGLDPIKLFELDDHSLVKRIVQLWSHFFNRVLSFWLAIFEPLQNMFSGFYSLGTSPNTTLIEMWSKSAETWLVSSEPLDLQRLTLLWFRDIMVIPFSVRLESILSNAGLEHGKTIQLGDGNSSISVKTARGLLHLACSITTARSADSKQRVIENINSGLRVLLHRDYDLSNLNSATLDHSAQLAS
ncbi:hypothetical protein CANCADRAFT_123432 [Tortispora caseinolytica NRRL Y-17796]|uniref:HbrB-like protein n=1 Tax=Tortispora caseinolytica NRRL Y-17796 TaxID=767744 RepID=A0A1E4TI20_9ASCO|nr:hypothetical protein CANCADRAFT_123432 [Tortispora caseinolytica NRRL Y-17796]